MNKTALVTGASSGIGFAACEMLLEKGYTVYGLSRRGTGPEGIQGVTCDVTDEEAVNEAVKGIIEATGRLDLLVNNAGFGISGPVEFTKSFDADKQMRVNFVGQFLMAKAVLPYMRKQQAGKIIFVSSVAGEMAIPYQAFYSASKAAVNSLALALKNEVRDFGIKIAIVMPGDTRTSFTDLREKETLGDRVYTKNDSAVKAMEKDERNGMAPSEVAKVIMKAEKAANPRPFYIAGGKYRFFHVLVKFLPAKLVYFVIGKMYA